MARHYYRTKGAGPIIIRPAGEDDIPKIVEIGRANFPDSNISEMRMLHRLSRGHSLFVAEIDAEVVGFIDIKLGISGALISGLATRPGLRGMGVGTALLGHAMDFAKKHGRLEIELRVAARNLRALNLYKKHGFVVLNRKVRKGGMVIYRMLWSFEM